MLLVDDDEFVCGLFVEADLIVRGDKEMVNSYIYTHRFTKKAAKNE